MIVRVRAAAVAALFAVALTQPVVAQEALTGSLPDGRGVALVQWSGGSTSALVDAASAGGCELRTVWVTVQGRFVGLVIGAPEFANAEWSTEVGTDVPATLLLVVCRTHGLDTCTEVSAGVVDHVAGPGAATAREALDIGLETFFTYPEGEFVEAEVTENRVTWQLVASDGVVVGEYHTERDQYGWWLVSREVCSS